MADFTASVEDYIRNRGAVSYRDGQEYFRREICAGDTSRSQSAMDEEFNSICDSLIEAKKVHRGDDDLLYWGAVEAVDSEAQQASKRQRRHGPRCEIKHFVFSYLPELKL